MMIIATVQFCMTIKSYSRCYTRAYVMKDRRDSNAGVSCEFCEAFRIMFFTEQTWCKGVKGIYYLVLTFISKYTCPQSFLIYVILKCLY